MTQAQLAFIKDEEGWNDPWKVPPLATSGVTIGYGYDLGQVMPPAFLNDWGALDLFTKNVLRTYAGPRNRGDAVRQRVARDSALRQTHVSPEIALGVLVNKSWPFYTAIAFKTFPGLESFKESAPDTVFALTSLVYNRGGRIDEADWDHPENFRREEIRFIIDYVAEGNLPRIADMLVIMARLWRGRDGAPGLVRRRIREATLVDPTVVERLGELKELWGA